MVFAEPCKGGNIIQTQILRAMFLNIVADIHKLFCMFLLFVRGCVKGRPLAGIFAANKHQHLQKLRVNGCADQDGTAVILLIDVQHQLL